MPHSLHPSFVESLSFGPGHLAALSRLGEHRGHQELYLAQSPQELEHLRHAAIVASTVSSNRIEGIEVSEARVSQMMRGAPNPRTRSEEEVAGYRHVLELIHDSYEHMELRPNMLLQLHKLLYRYHPSPGGRYKSQDNEIIETSASGETSALATPEHMETMCRRHNSLRGEYHPLVLLPLLILDFLCIHPFRDGNGRMSRLLTLLELHRAGYIVGRYVSVERVIERTKVGYYEALEASSQGWHEGEHDVRPWLTYFWGMLEGTYAEFEERVAQALSSQTNKSDAVELVVLSMTEPFQVSDLMGRLGHVSRATISRRLAALRERGLVELVGRGRGARWHVVERS